MPHLIHYLENSFTANKSIMPQENRALQGCESESGWKVWKWEGMRKGQKKEQCLEDTRWRLTIYLNFWRQARNRKDVPQEGSAQKEAEEWKWQLPLASSTVKRGKLDANLVAHTCSRVTRGGKTHQNSRYEIICRKDTRKSVRKWLKSRFLVKINYITWSYHFSFNPLLWVTLEPCISCNLDK